MELKIREVYRFFGRKMQVPDVEVRAVSTDTRTIKKGDIFFAIRGEKIDGHKFIAQALKTGALCCVTEKNIKGTAGSRIIKVKSTKAALLKLAGYYFRKFKKVKTLVITGSNGKTTTKEIAARLLSEKYSVLKSEKSFNNYIGLPATIFALEKKHGALVAELGMNNPGEIRSLVSAVKADAAIITNVGRAHIGRMKSLENTAAAKAEIFGGVKKGGLAILNGEDRFFEFLRKKAKGLSVMSFGTGRTCDVRVAPSWERGGSQEFGLEYRGVHAEMKSQLKGLHNLYNIAAAAAAALRLGVDLNSIKRALIKFDMKGLMRFEETADKKRGVRIINDSYNANPDSFGAAIESLRHNNYGSLIVVAGDMFELGSHSAAFHAEVGRKLASLDIKKLILVGKHVKHLGSAYIKENGREYAADVVLCKDRGKAAIALKKAVKKGDTVFLKGSRANKLEEIIKTFNI